MIDPKWTLKTRFEKVLEGENYLGVLLNVYEQLDNPIMIKMKDEQGHYTREYRHSDVLSKGYAFSQIHKALDGHNVAYISDNHIDIIATEVGCMISQKYTTGFYKNDSIEDICFKIEDADVNIMIVDQSGLDKIKDLPAEVKSRLKMIFLLEGTPLPESKMGFNDMKPLELPADDSKVSLINRGDPKSDEDKIVKVVYTSGSTGNPKGVPLTNKNCLHAGYGFIKNMFCGSEERETTAFFLPNAHIFQSACMGLAYAGLFVGSITSKETFKEDMPKINPTYLFGVPLLFQKIAQQVELKMTSILGGFFKEKDLVSPTWKNRLFIRPLFTKILRKKLGFSKIKTIFCAGAALNSKIYDFYEHTFGFKVTSGYGLSETTATLTLDPIGKKGASGKVSVVDTVEIRDKNEDGVGDIWVKGGNVFGGYLNDKEKEYFDEGGFFKTGDRGLFDDEGFIYIKGRIKNFHKGADGRFYNIEAIAEKILEKTHHIQQVAVHLLNSPLPVALVALGEEFLDFDAYKNDKHFLTEIKKECQSIRDQLKKEKYHPIPQKFMLTASYTEENGLLTPTKKIKVSKVLAFYEEGIHNVLKDEGLEFMICSEDQSLSHL